MIVDGLKKENISRAVELILAGDVVGFPTETVYGLGGDLLSETAVAKIFRVKERPHSDPLILHIASQDQLNFLAEEISEVGKLLIERFWPGPLTLILPKKSVVPDSVTAGLKTVAVRMPRHLVALALIKNSGKIIVAPSANRFQKLSPTSATAVEKELGQKIPLILDGGPCLVGVESTVLSLVDEPVILRPGGVTLEDIENLLGYKIKMGEAEKIDSRLSPGLLMFHYSPLKPLKFFKALELTQFAGLKCNAKVIQSGVLLCYSKDEEKKFKFAGFRETIILSSRGNQEEAAQNLFAMLRKADEGESHRIFALECPPHGLGATLNDRLKKAEHGFED